MTTIQGEPAPVPATVRGLVLVAAAVIAAATVALPAWPASSAPRGDAAVSRCGTVAGAAWAYLGQTGRHYLVYAHGAASCSFARRAVPRLTHSRPGAILTGAPAGWYCASQSLTARSAVTGFCHPRARPSSGIIGWAGTR